MSGLWATGPIAVPGLEGLLYKEGGPIRMKGWASFWIRIQGQANSLLLESEDGTFARSSTVSFGVLQFCGCSSDPGACFSQAAGTGDLHDRG